MRRTASRAFQVLWLSLQLPFAAGRSTLFTQIFIIRRICPDISGLGMLTGLIGLGIEAPCPCHRMESKAIKPQLFHRLACPTGETRRLVGGGGQLRCPACSYCTALENGIPISPPPAELVPSEKIRAVRDQYSLARLTGASWRSRSPSWTGMQPSWMSAQGVGTLRRLSGPDAYCPGCVSLSRS